MITKHIQFSLFIVTVLFCFSSGARVLPVAAMDDEAPIFIEALGDVPFMPGLEVQEESLVLFDKAQGRYVEVAAYAQTGVSQQDILDFYASALPALGWGHIGASSYKRGQEMLKIELKNVEGLVVARFIVSPVKN